MKKILAGLLSIFFCMLAPLSASAQDASPLMESSGQSGKEASLPGPAVSAPSAILIDADTGAVLYQKEADRELPPASVTKVMTLLLTFEAMENGKIKPDDTVSVSEHAAGMGGSQVYLEENETQSADTMIKCITVASANDACVAMAEHIAGSEEAFVSLMNQKAADLGMTHTHFVNSCGLDTDGHYSSARDIAVMSRELTTRFPQIFDYTKIWMEDITHHTSKGDSSFTLSNTNRLLKQYEYATGLKTGSTDKAGFCLSATASKDGIHLIAVIMAAESSKQRIADAKSLFQWGFANCRILEDANTDSLPDVTVTGGQKSSLSVCYEGAFRYMDVSGSDTQLGKTVDLPESIAAPVTKGDFIGKAVYRLGDTVVGEVRILAGEDIRELTLKDSVFQLLHLLLLGDQTIQGNGSP